MSLACGLLVSAGGCGSSSSGGVSVAGQVFAAPVDGATVHVFAADPQGQPTGDALATTTTDGSGHYKVSVDDAPGNALIVTATGGSYVSEADGTTQTLGTLTALLPASAAGVNQVEINPLTNAITGAAQNLAATKGMALAAAVGDANAAVKKLIGLDALAGDPGSTAADPAATSGDGWLLAALAGTLEQLRANTALSPAQLYQAMQDDVADTRLDGLKNAQPVALGSGALQSSLFTTQWSGAANAFGAANPQYRAAVTSISDALQAAAQANGIVVGSSGSIAPLQTQSTGTQLFFAARADGLVVLDMKDPASPAATRMAAINAAVMRNAAGTTGFYTSLDGIVINPTPINTPGGPKVFALLFSYLSKVVVSVNLTDGTLAQTATLPISRTVSFSGATASIAGGIADGKRGLIWLATADGLMGLDPSDLTKAPTLIAQPASTQINENLGGDPARDIVYSPDYLNRGLVIFQLGEAKAYVMDPATWKTVTSSWVAGELDGVALDSQYQVAVIAPEGGGTVGLLTYTRPSGSTAAVGAITDTPRFKLFTAGGSPAGSALDPITHSVLLIGEGSGMTVGVLDDPSSPTWAGFSKLARTGTSTYHFEPHDPHTVGVFNVQGKPYGFLLQGSGSPYKVVVVDLPAFLAAPATSSVLNADPMADASIVKQLAY